MKWLSNSKAYPMAILVIVVSIVLQVVWLNQLFRSQRVQVGRDLEEMVIQSAQVSTYLSVAPGHENSKNFKAFFSSPEWTQFRQAFDKMRYNNVGSRFSTNTEGDSTFVDISLRLFNGSTNHKRRHSIRVDDDPDSVVLADDRHDAKRMDSIIDQKIGQLGFAVKHYNLKYDFDESLNNKKLDSIIKSAAFVSQQYAYDLRFLRMYQLAVPSMNGIVLYRMRYYLLSSLFMLLLTVAVFIFILRLMHNQRLYAQARVSFTSNMTHELKTPVSTVALALESIMENHLENDVRTLKNYLEISLGELKRLNLMIDKVLNLEQVDSGQAKLRNELFDVQLGLQEVITSMQLQIKNAGAIVTWTPNDTPCFVSGDPIHLTNVFFNLIENALKYGGQGIKLEITCACTLNDVVISFKDNGPGIAPIYHQRIFERFFRIPAGNADIHNVKGTGLGLNYVKQIIEKHAGHLKLESETGKGSNFILYLPKHHDL